MENLPDVDLVEQAATCDSSIATNKLKESLVLGTREHVKPLYSELDTIAHASTEPSGRAKRRKLVAGWNRIHVVLLSSIRVVSSCR